MVGVFNTIPFLASALQLASTVSGSATWPSKYDELEDIMLLNEGYRARKLALPVTPCNFQASTGFIPAAGFIRTAFHDVAPHNSGTGQGGLDASIAFELTGEAGADNAGPFANNTLTFLSRYYSTEASMSDLMALATYTAVRGCGGPAIPIKTGRKDAQQAGPLGVPKVTATQQSFKETFARIGFNTQEMIKLVACGHTLGGVHRPQFPAVVTNGTTPSQVQNFDTTEAKFDNRVAVEFVSNTTKNPLVVGPVNAQADKKIYTADGGVTIRQMTDAQTFQNECKVVMQKMLEVVPRGVSLTDAIQPYDVKPGSLSFSLSGNGTLVFAGEIRVRTTPSQVRSVSLLFQGRGGLKSNSSVSTTAVGTATGHDDSFAFHSFTALFDSKASISSFDVVVTGTDGTAKTFNNNGKGFPVQDSLFVHLPSCSLGATASGGKTSVNIVAAVRGSASSVSLTSTIQQARDVPLPLLLSTTVPMTKVSSLGEFSFYEASFQASQQQLATATFDVSAAINGKAVEDQFHKIAGFGDGGVPGSPDGGDGGDGSNGGHGSSGGNGGNEHDWINIPGGGSGNTCTPSGDPNRAYTPTRPCGELEACDTLPWTHDLPGPCPDTYAPPNSPGAPKPGSGGSGHSSDGGGSGWGGSGDASNGGNGGDTGGNGRGWEGYGHVPVGPTVSHGPVASIPTSTPVGSGSGDGVADYTGAASRVLGHAGLVSGAVAVAVLLL